MTYKEIQKKLEKCELALTSIQNGTYTNGKLSEKEALNKLTTIKESLEKKLNLLKEEETMFVSTKGGDTKAVSMDTKAAMDLKKDPNITGITTAKGKDLKEDDLSDEEQEEITTETSHTEVVAKEVHKALIDALQDTGHEVSQDDISSLNPETFTISIRFKDNTQSDYSFEFVNGEIKLDGNIIVTANKKGITPVLNKTIAKNNLVKYFQNLTEKKGKDLDGDGDIDSDDYLLAKDKAIKANMKEEETEFEADAKGKPTGNLRAKLSDKDKKTLKKIEDLLAKEKNENKGISEGPYQTSYIKVSKRDYKKAISIIDQNIDPTYVKTDIVDDDGAGNVIIYFTFRHQYGFDDMYDDPEGKENPELYQEPEEDPGEFISDLSMDLESHGITIVDKSHDLDEDYDPDQEQLDDEDEIFMPVDDEGRPLGETDEAIDINDPALMRARVAKMRADDMKKLDAYKKSPEGRAAARAQASAERKEEKAREVVRKLKIKRAEIEREMENDPEIEPQGGPVADMYGDQLNKIDNAIEKAASVYNKPMDYDTAVGKVTEEDRFAGSDPKAGSTIKGRGFMAPRQKTKVTQRDIDDIEASGNIDIAYKRAMDLLKTMMDRDIKGLEKLTEEDKMKEHISVGHPDNEPGMLKQDAHDIAHYAVKLYKLLKYYESLEDQVDFPHWWQSKVVKAREYISKAAHYLEFKTNEPAIDANVDALQEGRSANAIKKEYDALVSKMIELAKEYKKAEGEEKKQLVAQLKDHTKTKKALEKELEQAVEKTGAGQELDTSINELSTDQRNDLVELQNILDDVAQKGEEAREIIRQSFPRMLSKADAYGAFDFGSSANRYDTTLESIIEEIEEYYDEEEDLDEIRMFHDPIGYQKSEPETPVFTKKYVGKDAYHILKNGKKLMTLFGSEGEANAYVNKRNKEVWADEDDMDEGRKDNDALYPDNPRLPNIKNLADKIVSMVKAEADKGELGYIKTMEELRYQQEDDFERTPEWNKAKGIRSDFDDYGNTDEEYKGKHQGTNYKWPMSKATKDRKEETKKKIDFFRKVKVGDKVKYLGKDKNGFSKGDTVTVDSFTSSSTFDKVLTLKKDNKKLRVASQSSIGPLEKGNLKEEMDGGRLFDYFKSKGYDITERRPDGYPPKEGVVGYQVSRGGDRYPQAVIFQHNKDTDEFTISRMSGYRIDQKEAIKAGMRQAGRSGAAGMDSYMTDGNYTPVSISAKGLKDIVDHVMSGLDREGQAQSDFYKDRGPTSGTVDEDAVKELYDKDFNYDSISMDDVKGMDLKPGKYQMVFKHKNGKLDQRNYPDLRSFTAGATQFFEYEHFLKKFGIEDKVRSGEISLKQHEDEFVDKYFDEIIDLINNSSNVILLVNGKPIAGGTINKDRGRTSGTIDEGATCCGRCGRVHVKGSGCKRPYLKGKDHCRTK